MPDKIEIQHLKVNHESKKEFDILGPTNNNDFKVLGVYSDTSNIDIIDFFEKDSKLQNRKIWAIKVVIFGKNKNNTWQGIITVRTSNHRKPKLEIPVSVKQTLEIQAFPSTLFFKKSETHSEIVVFSEDLPFNIKSVVSPEWLSVRKNILNSKKCQLVVEKNKNMEDCNSRKGTIKVFFENNYSIEIPVIML